MGLGGSLERKILECVNKDVQRNVKKKMTELSFGCTFHKCLFIVS